RAERHGLSGDDGRLAVRADLPGRVERAAARAAGLPELRRADRAHEVVRPDGRAAHRALLLVLAQAALDRLDLELALVHVREVLGRPEEHVDERAEEGRDRAHERREPDEHRLGDTAAGVLPDPVDRREPEDDHEQNTNRANHGPRLGVEEVVHAPEDTRDHSSILPSTHPAINASPTQKTSKTAAKRKTPR